MASLALALALLPASARAGEAPRPTVALCDPLPDAPPAEAEVVGAGLDGRLILATGHGAAFELDACGTWSSAFQRPQFPPAWSRPEVAELVCRPDGRLVARVELGGDDSRLVELGARGELTVIGSPTRRGALFANDDVAAVASQDRVEVFGPAGRLRELIAEHDDSAAVLTSTGVLVWAAYDRPRATSIDLTSGAVRKLTSWPVAARFASLLALRDGRVLVAGGDGARMRVVAVDPRIDRAFELPALAAAASHPKLLELADRTLLASAGDGTLATLARGGRRWDVVPASVPDQCALALLSPGRVLLLSYHQSFVLDLQERTVRSRALRDAGPMIREGERTLVFTSAGIVAWDGRAYSFEARRSWARPSAARGLDGAIVVLDSGGACATWASRPRTFGACPRLRLKDGEHVAAMGSLASGDVLAVVADGGARRFVTLDPKRSVWTRAGASRCARCYNGRETVLPVAPRTFVIVSEEGAERLEVGGQPQTIVEGETGGVVLADGRVLLGTESQGLVRYDPASRGLEPLPATLPAGKEVALGGRPMVEVEDGVLLLGWFPVLYDPKQGTLEAQPATDETFVRGVLTSGGEILVSTTHDDLDVTRPYRAVSARASAAVLRVERPASVEALRATRNECRRGGHRVQGPAPRDLVLLDDCDALAIEAGKLVRLGSRPGEIAGADRVGALARLADGRVLVLGGRKAWAYDPASGKLQPLRAPLQGGGRLALRLSDDRVLVVSDDGRGTAQIYDAARDEWSATAPFGKFPRAATLLADGRPLVVSVSRPAGDVRTPDGVTWARVLDLATLQWTDVTVPLASSLALLADGRLAAGGSFAPPGVLALDGTWTRGEGPTAAVIVGPDEVPRFVGVHNPLMPAGSESAAVWTWSTDGFHEGAPLAAVPGPSIHSGFADERGTLTLFVETAGRLTRWQP